MYLGSLSNMLLGSEVETPEDAVLFLHDLFFDVPVDEGVLKQFADFLRKEIGGSDLRSSKSFLEEPLRKVLHNMLSLPEYQLG